MADDRRAGNDVGEGDGRGGRGGIGMVNMVHGGDVVVGISARGGCIRGRVRGGRI